eukprot:424148_1
MASVKDRAFRSQYKGKNKFKPHLPQILHHVPYPIKYSRNGVDIQCTYIIDRFLLSMALVYNSNRQTIVIKAITIKHAHFNVNLQIFKAKKMTNESVYRGILSITGVHRNIHSNGSFQRYLEFLDGGTPLIELTEDTTSKRLGHKPILKRKIELKVSVSALPVAKALDAYLLTITFDRAPSLLRNKTFKIPIDYHQVLKQHFGSTIACIYNAVLPNELVSLIFDGFLTKYFWIYPSSHTSFFETLRLDSYILDKIPIATRFACLDRGLEACHGESFQAVCDTCGGDGLLLLEEFICCECDTRRQVDYTVHTVSHSLSLIRNVEYIPTGDPNDAIKCNINGVGISIDISDQSINAETYPSLFKMFQFYDIKQPELSTIWPLNNPSQLYDLKHLYEGIEKYCDRNDAIQVNAQLLIDKNVENNDILLLLVHWKGSDDKESHNEYLRSLNEELMSIHNQRRWDRNFNYNDYGREDIMFRLHFSPRDRCHAKAQRASHRDFNESVELYKNLIADYSTSVKETRDIIYNDDQHFGEPLIALQQLVSKSRFDYIIGNDKQTVLVSKEYLSNKLNQKRLEKIHKRKQRGSGKDMIHSAKHQKKMSKNKLYKTKKYHYHRW